MIVLKFLAMFLNLKAKLIFEIDYLYLLEY